MPDPLADILIVTVTKVESKTVLQVFEQAAGQKAKPTSIDGRVYFDLGTATAPDSVRRAPSVHVAYCCKFELCTCNSPRSFVYKST